MATIHFRDIQRWLEQQGQDDARPGSGMFLEIRFDNTNARPLATDSEFANRVLSVDSAQGIVTLVFDSAGQLKSLDVS